jgi:hypothetical protein
MNQSAHVESKGEGYSPRHAVVEALATSWGARRTSAPFVLTVSRPAEVGSGTSAVTDASRNVPRRLPTNRRRYGQPVGLFPRPVSSRGGFFKE